MNKKDQLLADTLGDNGEHFARLAAAHARRRRVTRRAGLAASLAGAVAAVLVLTRPPDTNTTVVHPPKKPAPSFEIISDDELLAQLKDQPVLILKDDTGITGIVFLATNAKL